MHKLNFEFMPQTQLATHMSTCLFSERDKTRTRVKNGNGAYSLGSLA